jgi:hypothetical protein
MPSIDIPYMPNGGSIGKILEKIKTAGTPENFNSDFLGTKLGFKGGNNRMFIPWSKKTGLINSDGTPSLLYSQFRNPKTSKAAMAKAIKKGYAELYERNEYCHDLGRDEFAGLVAEATGEPSDSAKLKMIVTTFFGAKSFADFDNPELKEVPTEVLNEKKAVDAEPPSPTFVPPGIGLNYTINLTLPKTDDPGVYAAIFKALRENLLK